MKIGEKPNRKHDQKYRSRFLATYGDLSIYDIYIEKIYSIGNEEINFVDKYGYVLIGNPEHIDGTSTDHEYFIIYDDLFDRVLETDQNYDIVLKVIQKYL